MNTRKIIFQNAAKIYAAIVGFYFLIKLIGLTHVIELRFLNILFVLWGINTAIKTNIQQQDHNNYLNNLFTGFSTGLFAIVATIISMIIYVSFIDDSLLVMLQKSSFWGNHLNLPKIVFSMTIEATASCVISSFGLMQYWKKQNINSYA
ncbi:hypothetical protein FHR24_001639 [Wenyingzhuangia heitensis]|uniref:DUF4199 domain-containing protein n=1 Tax=Wenyingzhuangia heitensis TaxID=1487859 RepID=A0ABX0UB95_9FLAO|nr:hypothetical protein [Wenyingzhuangia heitensis]NIJ45200.1 hypothetical protein [Wenyingzhuangia heitensis]